MLGGTFDPVHLGHLRIAQEVRRAFALRRVLLVPCATPPHKEARQVTPAAQRIAMLRLAIAGNADSLEISMEEIERGGTSYTIDTLRTLRDLRGLDPLFILGMDALFEISTWREYERLLEEFDLVAVDRSRAGGAAPAELDPGVARRLVPVSRKRLLQEGRGRVFHLRMDPLPISSREIRKRVVAGAPLDGLVPPEVARYIQEQGLYREETNR